MKSNPAFWFAVVLGTAFVSLAVSTPASGQQGQFMVPGDHLQKPRSTLEFEASLPADVRQHIGAAELAACGPEHPRIASYFSDEPVIEDPVGPPPQSPFGYLVNRSPTAVLEGAVVATGTPHHSSMGPVIFITPVHFRVDRVVATLLGFPQVGPGDVLVVDTGGGIGLLIDGSCSETFGPGTRMVVGNRYLFLAQAWQGKISSGFGNKWFELAPDGSLLALRPEQLLLGLDLHSAARFEFDFVSWLNGEAAKRH